MFASFFSSNGRNLKCSNIVIELNSNIVRLFYCCFFMVMAWNGVGQEKFMKQFSFSEGLQTNTIFEVHQDRKGYIWLATDLGVYRYGGTAIEHYMPDDGLPDVEILGFNEDSQGRLWFRTLSGKVGFYKEGVFYHDQLDFSKIPNPPNSVISAIKEYKEYVYIFFIEGRFFKINRNNEIVADKKLPHRISEVIIENDEMITAVYGNLDIWDLETLEKKASIPCYRHTSYIRVARYKDNYLYGLGNFLYVLDLQKQETYIIDSFPAQIIRVDVIDSLVWVGTRNGAYQIKVTPDFKTKELSSVLKGESVTSICKDFEGGLWFSSLSKSVFYLYNENLNVAYRTNSSNVISNITSDPKKQVWLTFFNNEYRVGHFPNLKQEHLSPLKNYRVIQPRFLDGDAWIMGGMTLKKAASNEKNLGDKIYISSSIKDLILDKNQNYIIGGSNVLLKIPKAKMDHFLNKDKIAPTRFPDSIKLYKNRINRLYKDKNEGIWIGANNGLFQLQEDSIVEVRYQDESLDAIRYFCEYTDSSFMVVTKKQGVFIAYNNKIIHKISVEDGLNSSSCLKCVKGKNNHIWILTSKGLNQLIPSFSKLTIRNVSADLGIEKKRIMDITTLDDTLLIALPYQVLSYVPQKETTNIPPKLIINSIKVNGKSYKREQLNLSPEQTNIEIAFTGISYKNNKNITYQYQLIGASDEWSFTANKSIQFEALSPGYYLFRVKAINGEGIESRVIEIPFYIEIPLYKNNWFIVGLILLTIGVTWYLIKRRIDRLEQRHLMKEQMILAEKKKAELESELREIEQQALRLQMNPHFIFNALNTIKGYYSSKDIQKANTYISKFSKLLRIMLEHKEPIISLSKEKELLDLYLKLVMLRYDTAFVFSFDIDATINPDEVVIPSMLFQPFIENSIIHGISTMLKDGKIEIIVRKKGGQLHCVIRDNGIGRIAAKKRTFGKSNRVNALDIIKRRLELIQKESGGETSIAINDLYDNEKAIGTEVILTLPYKEQW